MRVKYLGFAGRLLLIMVLMIPMGRARAQNDTDLAFHIAPRPKCQKEKPNDLTREGLKGMVKKTITARYSCAPVPGSIPQLIETVTNEYDSTGTMTGKRISYSNSSLASILTRKFDKDRNVLSDFFYNSDTSYYVLTEYEYYDGGGIKSESAHSYQQGASIINVSKEYDKSGNCVEKDSSSDKKTYKYDGFGNCIEMTDYLEVVDHSGRFMTDTAITIYTYDPDCRLVLSECSGFIKVKTDYKYDDKGRLIEESRKDFISHLNEVKTYKYDDMGNRIDNRSSVNMYSQNNPRGYQQTYQYVYDSQSNWTKKEVFNASVVFIREERQITYY